MKIAIDCDGVLANFHEAFGETANRMYPARWPLGWQPDRWGLDSIYSEDELDAIWARIRATPNWWMGLPAYSEGVGALARFFVKHSGVDVYVVTARPDTLGMTVAMQTDKWLRGCGVRELHNHMGVIVVANASAKAGVYRAMGFDVSIDDKVETVKQCQEMRHPHRAYLLDQPWNRHVVVRDRVGSVEEFLERAREQ